jgi:hypothetical protein
MKSVGPPPHGLFRVSRADRPVFAPANWSHSGRSRFDDPLRLRNADQPFDPARNFQVVYGASTLTAAFVETLQALRPSLHDIARLRDIAKLRDIDTEEPVDRLAGRISATWRARRHWGVANLPAALKFVDIAAAETLQDLRETPKLARIADACGLPDIDVSAVTGPSRRFTQSIARFIYQSEPNYAGIRYLSRFGTDNEYECWAVFTDRANFGAVPPHPIPATIPDLITAATHLNLTIDPA